jgi:hypothetical protein
MSRSRSPHATRRPAARSALGRALGLLLAATGTVVASPVAVTATPAAPAAAARASVVDTDGDGLDDTIDGCPTVASANPTGCPTASRTVSLRWAEGRERLLARVTSPVPACASRARIKVFLDRRGGTDKLLASDASYRGRRAFEVPRGARYYAVVTPTYASGLAECAKGVSRTVKVPG